MSDSSGQPTQPQDIGATDQDSNQEQTTPPPQQTAATEHPDLSAKLHEKNDATWARGDLQGQGGGR